MYRARSGQHQLTMTSVVQLYSQGKAGHNRNCWRSPHSHRPDAVEAVLARSSDIVAVLVGQPELVQDLELAPGVLDGLQTGHLVTGGIVSK